MDARTRDLIDALDATGVELLVVLLAGPATEHELRTRVPFTSQASVNRRLHRLRRAGLVVQQPGRAHAPGRIWRLIHVEQTERLVAAAVDLSDAIDAADREQRVELRRQMLAAKAARLGIRAVDSR